MSASISAVQFRISDYELQEAGKEPALLPSVANTSLPAGEATDGPTVLRREGKNEAIQQLYETRARELPTIQWCRNIQLD